MYSSDDALQRQLAALDITAEDWDTSGAGGHLQFAVPSDAAPVRFDTVDARTNDTDGTPIDIILHVVDGHLNWGEWCRVDAQRIQSWPPRS